MCERRHPIISAETNIVFGLVICSSSQVHAELQTTDKWKLSTRSFEADVMSKTSFWCRKRCGFCVKISRSCCPADDVSSENNSKRRQSWAPLRRRQSTFSMDTGVDAVTQYELQEAEWKDEKLFLARMRQLMREARRKKNIDLFSYVDKIYQQFDDINLYVGTCAHQPLQWVEGMATSQLTLACWYLRAKSGKHMAP